jgi:predicted TPR repeat methyltransferase
MPNPKLAPVILLSPVENGYVAYDPVADWLHHLNPIAALLAELCDGSRSIDDIRALVEPLLPEGQVGEIQRWFDEALKAGLLIWNDGAPETHKELSAAELHNLAKRLMGHGKVQTAFVCAKRAVELKPDEWDAWYDLGEIAQCVGRRDEALVAYQKYFEVHSDDAEIEHLLVALKDATPPPRASDKTIQQIYKGFARTYETRMREDLKYQGPERMSDGIRAVIGDQGGLSVLDLGCGSGLAGTCFKHWASRMIGVDLSPEMIELASKRNLYDRFEIGEITQWLRDTQERFDLIGSCDVIIYFGDLHDIVAAAAERLNAGGVFAMSMEKGDRYPFHLTDTGRYTHHPDHVREAAAVAGLTVAYLEDAFLRMEYGSPVMGLFAVLKKSGAQ